jgi:hypothetical protein
MSCYCYSHTFTLGTAHFGLWLILILTFGVSWPPLAVGLSCFLFLLCLCLVVWSLVLSGLFIAYYGMPSLVLSSCLVRKLKLKVLYKQTGFFKSKSKSKLTA